MPSGSLQPTLSAPVLPQPWGRTQSCLLRRRGKCFKTSCFPPKGVKDGTSSAPSSFQDAPRWDQ